ncbi:dTDP-glucose 4,6-dehydratase [Rubripirellula tenax]|uniref:dTDP-glucose 4,6-dehydratase n=1 Tax=Rubripirellula tenax TaxID=2528015 RepID=A0A5C6FJL6_9BACT|nr:NAD-dependent epimerase/dehydratase family protein [Rubripirellula tenax]TWU59832.1 dTDP-glucose 4,6-dehydratase [Rubripirellula tenax]
MRIFLTGATGLLGNTIVRHLAVHRPGDVIHALVRRPPEPKIFEGMDVQFVEADLGDAATYPAIAEAIQHCDVVIHAAALIHIGWKRLNASMQVNRDGTAAIVDACLAHEKPLVHVGTVDTLALGNRSAPANEDTPLDANGEKTQCSYVVSKRAGVDVVMAGVRRGLRAVIVHPGFMLGPWDWKPSSGRMIVEVARTWRPLAPSGGCSICDPRDVAAGTIEAMDGIVEGRIDSGRQYILAGENWTYFELWREIAARTGAGKPVMPAGPGQRWIGSIVAGAMQKWSEKEGDFNTASLELSSQIHWYDSTRAHDELGYRIRDPHKSLDDAVDWIENRLPENSKSASKSGPKSGDF